MIRAIYTIEFVKGYLTGCTNVMEATYPDSSRKSVEDRLRKTVDSKRRIGNYIIVDWRIEPC